MNSLGFDVKPLRKSKVLTDNIRKNMFDDIK